jgi:hypothetical protein
MIAALATPTPSQGQGPAATSSAAGSVSGGQGSLPPQSLPPNAGNGPSTPTSTPPVLNGPPDGGCCRLLGLASEAVKPDIASAIRTNLSFNNDNLFHYDATPLIITLGDGSRFNIANQTGGVRHTQLDLHLDNSGNFVPGVPGDGFSVTGRVTINGNPFNGTLVTADVRDFGFCVHPTDTEFEVRLVITGGALTVQPTGVGRVGEELALLIHQPDLPISCFPQTFSFTSFAGSSDAERTREIYTNSEPETPGCG